MSAVSATPSNAVTGQSITIGVVGASDPGGRPLAFSWNFGDGTATGTGATVTHTYTSAGTFTPTVTVTDGLLLATASVTVGVATLAATWRGTIVASAPLDAVVTLTQTGATIGGTFNSINLTGTITGSINASTRHITFTVAVPGFQSFTFSGDPDAIAATLTGTANGSGFTDSPWVLKRL